MARAWPGDGGQGLSATRCVAESEPQLIMRKDGARPGHGGVAKGTASATAAICVELRQLVGAR
jgi:hypothetical protein